MKNEDGSSSPSARTIAARLTFVMAVSGAIVGLPLYALGVPPRILAFGGFLVLGFMLLPILTGATGRSDGLLHSRRLIAMFGVIPMLATLAGVIMFAAGVRSAGFYVFPILVFLGNVAYIVWFDSPPAHKTDLQDQNVPRV